MNRDRQNAEKSGRRAEWLTAAYLRVKGYAILARRFKTPGGEIDLIARKGRVVVFVEVKSRPTLDEAQIAVDYNNRKRIGAAAAMFMAKRPDLANYDLRYDIVAIAGRRWRHIQNAWREGD